MSTYNYKTATHQEYLDMVYDLLQLSPINDTERAMLKTLEDCRSMRCSDRKFIAKLHQKHQPVQPSI